MITRFGSYDQIKGSVIKLPCIAATVENITLSAVTNIIDDVQLQINDRVLVVNQTLSQYNGVYTVLSVGTGSDEMEITGINGPINEVLFDNPLISEVVGINGVTNDVLFDENTLNEIPNILITDFGFF